MSDKILRQEAFLETFNTFEHIEANKLEKYVRMSPGLLFSKDKNHNFLECNYNFAKISGHTPESILGLNDLDMNWEDAGNSAEEFHMGDKSVMKGKTFKNKYEIVAPPGEKANVLKVTKKPLVSSKKCIGIVGFAVNYADIFHQNETHDIFPYDENKLLSTMAYQVLMFYNQGYSRTEMAELLEVSPHTIAWHLRQMRIKYGVKTRRELLLLQRRHEEA